MRILVIGAGVIGSVYAGALAEAGHEVTLLARGDRLNQLSGAGLRVRRVGQPETRPDIVVTDTIPAAPQDLVVVAVRREQVRSAAQQAAAATAGTVLLFGNYAGLLEELAAMVGAGRTIAGFPGVGGRLDEGRVDYLLIAEQPTVVGRLAASAPQTETVARTLREAGFVTRVEQQVGDWLASHAALVVPLAGAIVAAAGSAAALSERKDLLRLAVRATRRIYRAQRRASRLVVNSNLRLLYLVMPEWFAVLYWSRALRGEFGELAFAAHSRHAWNEMAMLGAWLQTTLSGDPDAAQALERVTDLAAAQQRSDGF